MNRTRRDWIIIMEPLRNHGELVPSLLEWKSEEVDFRKQINLGLEME